MTELGPFVGHTTSNSVVIWGRRGGASQSNVTINVANVASGHTRCLPNCQLTNASDNVYRFLVDDLTPKTQYRIEVLGVYSQPRSCKVTTYPALDQDGDCSFLLGSCRAPDEHLYSFHGDSIFRAMRSETNIAFTILCGDQVYADLNTCGFFCPRYWLKDPTPEFYFRKYHTAFGKTFFHSLLTQTPTYMMPDDHELIDNYPQNGDEKYWNSAKESILSYQVLASPSPEPRNSSFYYNFQYNSRVRVFVLECRTERAHIPDQAPQMISVEQKMALFAWMQSPPPGFDGVSFIVSSVPVFPDFSKDQWTGFQEQRAEILDKIADINKETPIRVCFLSGDVHQATYTKLAGPNNTAVLSLVSSPLAWSGPRGQYVQRLLKLATECRCLRGCVGLKNAFYKCKGLSSGWRFEVKGKFVQGDNYMRVDVRRPDEVTFSCNDYLGHDYFHGTMDWVVRTPNPI